jgi:hypothetical protein
MIRYICVKECFHNSVRYVPGNVYFAHNDEKMPRHFIRPKEYMAVLPDIRPELNPDQQKAVEAAVVRAGGEVPLEASADKDKRKIPKAEARSELPKGAEETAPKDLGKFECKECSREFPSQHAYETHMKIKHGAKDKDPKTKEEPKRGANA